MRKSLSIVLGLIGLAIALLLPSLHFSPAIAQIPGENFTVREEVDGDRLEKKGREYYQMGQFSSAVEAWQAAVRVYQQRGDLTNQAKIWSNLALAYQQLGQWTDADRAIAHSFELLPAQPSLTTDKTAKAVLAQAWNNQGILRLAKGQSQQALQAWQKATDLYTQIEDRKGIRRSQINQTRALVSLGLYPRACTILLPLLGFDAVNCQSLTDSTLQEKLASLSPPLDSLQLSGWQSLGDILRQTGKLEESQLVLEAIAKLRSDRADEIEGNLLLSLGNTARSLGNYPEALQFYREAATVSPTVAAQSQLAQLHLAVEIKQWEPILALLPPIKASLEKLPLSHEKLYAQINFARSLLLLKQSKENKTLEAKIDSWQDIAELLADVIQKARKLGDERAEIYGLGSLGEVYQQTNQWSVARELTQQALLAAEAIDAPEMTYRWQWQLGRILQAQGDRENAIIAYQTGVETLKSITGDLAINPEVQFSFQEKVEPVYRELVNLLLQPDEAGNVPQDNIIRARKTIEDLQLAELNNFFRQDCLQAQAVNIDEVDRQAAVIYPIVLSDRLEIILSLPQQPLRHYPVPVAAEELERIIAQFRYTLVIRSQRQFFEPAQMLYDRLIRPLEAELSQNTVKTLVFVLDGSLRNIPVAALHDGQQYLLEKYEVALTPGLQLLEPQPLQRRGFSTLIAGLTEARNGFPPLDYVSQELAAIREKVATNILLDRTFTAETLEKAIEVSNYPIVHIATHGQFSSNIDKTFILAWDNRINIRQLDALLRSRSPNRETPIELLILSACETATGDKQAALGLAGMAVRSGARSTLATLWSINDRATAEFMDRFYEALVEQKLTKAQALRQAQLSLLNSSWYKHPFYWTPYVLVGNWL